MFEHSLRIRMGGDALYGNKKPTNATEAIVTLSFSSDVAAAEAIDGIDAEAEVDEGEESTGEIEDDAYVTNEKPDTKHLIGKINSLVTTDLLDVTFLQNLMRLRRQLSLYTKSIINLLMQPRPSFRPSLLSLSSMA